MSTVSNAWDLYDNTGHAVRTVHSDRNDSGVLRAYRRSSSGVLALVGLVVIRDGRVTYAEHDGVVFAFFPSDTQSRYESLMRDWRLTVKESAAT